LGSAYLAHGNREQATKEFQAELGINPRDFDANVSLGMIYREDGRFDEAANFIKTSMEVRPNEVSALFQMAQLQRERGLITEAIALFEQIRTQAPDFIPARVWLAQLYFKTNRNAEGERERAEIQRLTEAQQKFMEEIHKQGQPKNTSVKPTETSVSQSTSDNNQVTKKP
jgi:tetratricopeptide (TPR) repeat protein